MAQFGTTALTNSVPLLHVKVGCQSVPPLWLGDNSSVMKKVIERLYACSSILNSEGQYAYYGRSTAV